MKGKEKSITVDWVLIFTHLGAIWYIILNTCFHILNNIIRIFTFFSPTRISKKPENYCLNTHPERALTILHLILMKIS